MEGQNQLSQAGQSEISDLAHAEVSLLMQGVKFVNQELVKQFPDRILESIKGKRKAPAYRNLVTELLALAQSHQASGERGHQTSGARGTHQTPGVRSQLSPAARGHQSPGVRGFSPSSQSPTMPSVQAADFDPESTLIYGSLEYFVSDLNDSHPAPSLDEIKLLDEALLCARQDPDHAKALSTEFLLQTFQVKSLAESVIHHSEENTKMPKRSKFKKSKTLSNRKLNREACSRLQKIYAKNRKKAFEELFSKCSTSPTLCPEEVFSY